MYKFRKDDCKTEKKKIPNCAADHLNLILHNNSIIGINMYRKMGNTQMMHHLIFRTSLQNLEVIHQYIL